MNQKESISAGHTLRNRIIRLMAFTASAIIFGFIGWWLLNMAALPGSLRLDVRVVAYVFAALLGAISITATVLAMIIVSRMVKR